MWGVAGLEPRDWTVSPITVPRRLSPWTSRCIVPVANANRDSALLLAMRVSQADPALLDKEEFCQRQRSPRPWSDTPHRGTRQKRSSLTTRSVGRADARVSGEGGRVHCSSPFRVRRRGAKSAPSASTVSNTRARSSASVVGPGDTEALGRGRPQGLLDPGCRRRRTGPGAAPGLDRTFRNQLQVALVRPAAR